MKGTSIVTRVVGGTVLVALLSALVLAATAAGVARMLWRAGDRALVEETTAAFSRAIEMEAIEHGISIEAAAPEALAESAVVGYHIEIWQGERLLGRTPQGALIGPLVPSGGLEARTAGWIFRTNELPKGLTVIVALPEAHGLRALRVFAWSLLVSAPLCFVMAIVVGRLVGRKATRPLAEFTERVSRIRELKRLEPSPSRVLPAEIHDLEESFRSLLSRLAENLSREAGFAANASHELRTPLTSIRMRAERAMQDAGAQAKRELSDQLREIDRMVRIVDSLLVLARDVETAVPRGEVVNLADLARAAAAHTFAGGPIPMPEARVPDEAMVRGDEDLLRIAVENLLENARKFTPPGQRVVVDLTDGGGRVAFAVTSTGVRIADEDREQLFERFYRGPEARAAHPGHGLGLPLARHIARLHGGELRCVSRATEDARFVLDLPAWRGESA